VAKRAARKAERAAVRIRLKKGEVEG